MKEGKVSKRITDSEVMERLKQVLKEFDYKEDIWFNYDMITKEVKVFNHKQGEEVCVIYKGQINYLDEDIKYKMVCERLRDVIEEIKEEIDSTEDLINGEWDYLDFVE